MSCDCKNWCRTDLKFKDGKLLPCTKHHPRCVHVDDSLIDVWKVDDGTTHYFDEDEATARQEAESGENVTITKVKMHREIYDLLPEFSGF